MNTYWSTVAETVGSHEMTGDSQQFRRNRRSRRNHEVIAVEPQRHRDSEEHRDTQIDSSHHRIVATTKTPRREDIATSRFWTRVFWIGLHPVMQRQAAGTPRLGRHRPGATPCQVAVASRLERPIAKHMFAESAIISPRTALPARPPCLGGFKVLGIPIFLIKGKRTSTHESGGDQPLPCDSLFVV